MPRGRPLLSVSARLAAVRRKWLRSLRHRPLRGDAAVFAYKVDGFGDIRSKRRCRRGSRTLPSVQLPDFFGGKTFFELKRLGVEFAIQFFDLLNAQPVGKRD